LTAPDGPGILAEVALELLSVSVTREDGVVLEIGVLTLARLRDFLESLNPQYVDLATAEPDDMDALKAIISGDVALH